MYDDDRIRPPHRSDQFVTSVSAGANRVFATTKSVALDPENPYDATAVAVVLAYEAGTGSTLWSSTWDAGRYTSLLASALSPDGSRLFVTGAVYDAFPVSATDSEIITAAYDAVTGARLWSAYWDARPDAKDTGKVITASPNGRELYVAGITTSPEGDLDYVTVGYDASSGRELWSSTYAGPRPGGSDAPFDIAAAPDGRHVYVTGWSDAETDYDADYATVAIVTGRGPRGRVDWVARYDGVGAHKSDRANAVTVSSDGRHVIVTGDSYTGEQDGRTRYDVATVAYAARTGEPVWEARDGMRPALNSGRAVVAPGNTVVVTAQTPGAGADAGNDITTIAYDIRTGRQLWSDSYAPLQHNEHPVDVAASPDATRVYVTGTSVPNVPHTALAEQVVLAYDLATGARIWISRLDAGAGNALRGSSLTVTEGGDVAIVGEITRSQSPLGPPSQNRFDVLTAVFDG